LGFKSLIDLIAHGTAAAEASEGLQPPTQRTNALSSGRGLLNASSQNGGVLEKLPQAKAQQESKPRLLLRQVPGIKYGNSDPIKLPKRVAKSSSAILEVIDGEALKSSETKTRRKTDLELSDTSIVAQREDATADVEDFEDILSVDMEEPKSVRLRKTRTRVLQPVEKSKSSSVRSVVNTSNTSKASFDSSSSKSIIKKTKSSTIKAFVIDERWGLDTPISVVTSLSAPNRARLEESGFNTVSAAPSLQVLLHVVDITN
jgi:hypothetical protein